MLADLPGVAILDSTGLTCLIGAYRTARSPGAHMVLIAPSERVRHMLALTGADQVLPAVPPGHGPRLTTPSCVLVSQVMGCSRRNFRAGRRGR
ncbi:STAS domain-containing protein [Streptomyces avermitilis]|uniref:STAS domain-containing protein n=1 Tax=Streptomyces avermitilis TaxID=33903 RepID=UPI0036CCA1C2